MSTTVPNPTTANDKEQILSKQMLQHENATINESLNEMILTFVYNVFLMFQVLHNNLWTFNIEIYYKVKLLSKNDECLLINKEILSNIPRESRTFMNNYRVSCANNPTQFINSFVTPVISYISQVLCNRKRMKLLQHHEDNIPLSLISGSHSVSITAIF